MTLLPRPTSARSAGRQTSLLGGIANVVLTVVQMIVGFTSGSAALLADSFHTLTDLVTDIISYLAASIAHEPADETHNYGHGKFESIAVMLLSMLLALAGIGISWQAVERLLGGTCLTH